MFQKGKLYKHKNYRDVVIKVRNIDEYTEGYYIDVMFYNLHSYRVSGDLVCMGASEMMDVKIEDLGDWYELKC